MQKADREVLRRSWGTLQKADVTWPGVQEMPQAVRGKPCQAPETPWQVLEMLRQASETLWQVLEMLRQAPEMPWQVPGIFCREPGKA